MHCARVFSTCRMGAGLFCFSEGMEELLVCQGFLQVLDLVCKQTDNQAVVSHPCLSFHTLQIHHPSLVLFPENQWQFQCPWFGTPVGLLPV